MSNFRYQLQSEIDELKESLSSINSKQSGEINKPNIATVEENGDFPHHQILITKQNPMIRSIVLTSLA